MKIDDMEDYTYVLVQWPETQVLMGEDWFDKEASLADFNKFGNSAYFIPQKRWLELHDNSNYIKTVVINEKKYTLSYQSTKIGDELYDFGLQRLYIASMADADSLNWVVVSSNSI